MKLPKRQVEVFSLSFLDCICCGFGAIILLLVLAESGEPLVLEQSRLQLEGQVQELTEQLEQIRGETEILNRDLKGRLEQRDRERLRLARLSGDISSIQGKYSTSKTDASVTNILEKELVSAYQTLSAEMQRLLKSRQQLPAMNKVVGGIPVDSEYVIFVIDTSASMTSNHWPAAIQVLQEILDIYPRVKGMQILNDNGKPMFDGTRGQWLEDTPFQRRKMVLQMKAWRAFSDSNPADGIEEAIKTYWKADRRISVYVIGDEFTGESIQSALDSVAKVNRPGKEGGRRLVRIHAVGFPEGLNMTPFTNIRFSALMRAMCEQNDGTFVGITR